MTSKIQELQQDYHRFLQSISFDADTLDYAKVEEHAQILKSFDIIESSSISVFDLYQQKHVYNSDSFGKVLGYSEQEVDEMGDAFITLKTLPEDYLQLLENGVNLMHFVYEIPVDHRMNYKLITDFRIQNADGNYVRVIEQHQALELCPKGNIWLSLSILDISPDQDLDKPLKSKFLNFKTGKTDYLNEVPDKYSTKKAGHKLSKRELQILKLIKRGNFSKEIAHKLFISIHTVNTHRQNILQKLDVANSVEAVQYADRYGLFALLDN